MTLPVTTKIPPTVQAEDAAGYVMADKEGHEEDDNNASDDDDGPRRSSRAPAPRQSWSDEMTGYVSAADQAETAEEIKVEDAEVDLALVGAGVAGSFYNTADLKPIQHEEAMAGPDKAA